MSKKPPLSPDDLRLWQSFTKDIDRLDGGDAEPPSLWLSPPIKVMQKPSSLSSQSLALPVVPSSGRRKGQELDGRNQMRLRKGQLQIEATLDLHGLSQHQAHDAVKRFITNAYDRGQRCVLIITGKGRLNKPAILKKRVPEWLSEPPLAHIVLQTHISRPKHGGAGALYVYVRRKRL